MKNFKWLGLAVLVLSGAVQAASFDCAKAQSKVEKMICADAELSKLDEEMATVYQLVIPNVKDLEERKLLLVNQKKWLTSREWCDENAYEGGTCLGDIYSARIDSLRALVAKAKGKESSTAQRKPAYKVAHADPEYRKMCQEMVENLNSVSSTSPMICERMHNPRFTQFQPLVWRYWSVDEFKKRWPLLNEDKSLPYGRFSTESVLKAANEISLGTWGVGEISFSAPDENGIEGYLRLGIPPYQWPETYRLKDAENRKKLGMLKEYDYPTKDPGCSATEPVPLKENGAHVSSGVLDIARDAQLWLYTSDGQSRLISQRWRYIAPGFQWADLDMNSGSCVIRYLNPNALNVRVEEQ